MKSKQILGGIMISIPFILIFAVMAFYSSLISTLIIFGSVIFILGFIYLGVKLLMED